MGADIADIDNDTRPDIFVTEMLPEKILRYKTKALFENWDKYNLNVSKGYHRQFGRNVLQINQGNIGTNNTVRFSEISRYCGVDATDWSWGALIADFNNDCQKDIFVANGIFKDLTDLDYVNFDFNPEAIQSMIRQKQNVIISMMEKVPSEAQQNYLYINKGNYTFENMAAATGLSKPTYSNGSAYCDLDNDGDLDLVINNINETAHIYRNNTLHSKDHSFLNVSLKGTFPNINAIGSKIICYSNDTTIMQELNPMRGFESCVDPRIHIGLGKISALDSISVIWPDGWRSVITNISLNSFVKISYDQIEKSSPKTEISTRPETLLSPVSDGIGLKHIENEYSDFDRDRLLIYMVSNEGPPLAVKDLNKDGLEDIILGGSTGNATQIAYQKPNGRFSVSPLKASIPNAIMEDSDILIEDFDNDGLLDIYVSGGSSELPATSSGLKDRIYFGSTGGFIEKPAQFNSVYGATSAVVWMDMDDDGDKDIFAAGRLEPFNYGVPASSVVYENIAGHYTFSQTMSAPFRQFGMLNDAKSVDIDNDGKLDLILMRDMGNIEVVSIKAGRPIVRTTEFSLDKISGYWSSFEVVDINEDGYKDIIVCNKGLNNRIAAGYGSYELHVNDFDGNGQIEQLPCFAEGQNIFSWSMRDDLVKQLPGLKKKYLKYKDLASVGMKEMFDQQTLSKSVVYKINEFRSGVFKNVNGHFVFVPLPIQAQWTDQKAVLVTDLNGDGRKDILMGGNQFKAKPETGIDAATFGSVFINEGDMNFSYCQNIKSGIFVPGEIRDIKLIMIKNKKHVIFARNNDEVVLYKLNI
ncbi:MAG: VCBS repeat-containing protein [Saprospiraceae bacterium]|nr:VCBS repeat-containing protein [Saprospiraceae bacterium]